MRQGITADVKIDEEGTLYLFHLETDRAREWVEEHVDSERTYWCNALVVEHRFASHLAIGMLEDGLELE